MPQMDSTSANGGVSGRACNMAEEIGAAIPFLAAEHSGYTSDSVAVVDGPGAILLNS